VLGARPDLHLLGIDRDPAAVAAAGQALAPFGDRVTIRQGGFERVAEFVGNEGIVAILFDLGVSSPQLDRPVRGFSYWADAAPLDMRMDSAQTLTAATVVNEYAEADLAALIARNGEERYAKRIAAEIVAARPLEFTGDLVECVKRAVPAPARRRGGHPARRTFQAIRMEVNRELPSLAQGLDESVHLLKPEGRIAVLAYHSLEDRMVKERFTEWSRTEEPGYVPKELPRQSRTPLTRLLHRKAVRPSAAELERNPRAKSARLRAVERVGR
jgi:16S rRNA (cytosine1402-N4)-methyltransferase